MKFLTTAEYSLVALLVFSLAGKMATNGQDPDYAIADHTFASAVVKELTHVGFTTKVERWPTGVAVQARRGACLLWVRESNPHGTMLNIYDELARPVGPLRYFYRGVSLKEPPKLGPILKFFFNREMARLGIATSRFPIYAVASSTDCDLSSLRWPVAIG